MGAAERLVGARRFRVAREIALLYGIEIPASVQIGARFALHHRGRGVVIGEFTVIGDDVTIFQDVTVGRASIEPENAINDHTRVVIGNGAVICAGARVLRGEDDLTVAAGSVVAANAVLLTSTGPDEMWAGVPARRVAMRRARRPVDRQLSA